MLLETLLTDPLAICPSMDFENNDDMFTHRCNVKRMSKKRMMKSKASYDKKYQNYMTDIGTLKMQCLLTGVVQSWILKKLIGMKG